MKSKLLPFFLCAPLGLAFACGGGETPPVEGTGGTNSGGNTALGGSSDGGSAMGGSITKPTDSLFSVCREYVAEICKRRAECAGNSAEECETNGAYSCPDALFSEGSTRTIASVKACIEDWKTFPCEDALAWKLPACVAKGTKEDGDACAFHSQCASGECSGNAEECGVCIPVAAPGGSCEQGVMGCVPNEQCESGTCTPLPPIEKNPEPETPKALGASCTQACVEGAVCAADDSFTARICRPNRGEGESCYAEHPYVDANPICSSESGANAYPMPCDETNKCMGWAALGESCRPPAQPEETLGFSVCGAGLLCEGTGSYKCALEPAPGDACLLVASGSGCGATERCVEGICLTARFLGDSCGEADECVDHTTCVSGKCTPSDVLTMYEKACSPP